MTNRIAKYILITSLFLCISNVAMAFDGFSVFYLNNEHFNRIDEVSNAQGGVNYTDESGRPLGHSLKNSDGSFSYKDKIGLLVGSSAEVSKGNFVYKNKLGNPIGHAVTEKDGSTIYKDIKENVIAVASAD